MLVVHPKDKTTSVLSALYEGKDANVISVNCSKKEMEHLSQNVSDPLSHELKIRDLGCNSMIFDWISIKFCIFADG